LVYQYGMEVEEDEEELADFAFDVELREADTIPSGKFEPTYTLSQQYNSSALIPEDSSHWDKLAGTTVECTITDFYGNNVFSQYIIQSEYIDSEGFATITFDKVDMDDLLPGVYRVNFRVHEGLYTKEYRTFSILEVRPKNFMKFGEKSTQLDLINWYASGWGRGFIGEEQMVYEDVYPHLIGYFTTLHNDSGLQDYVFIDILAQVYNESDGSWGEWIPLKSGIPLRSLKYDGLYYIDIGLGADGQFLMGNSRVRLNISADCTYNELDMVENIRTQRLYVLNLSIISSNNRDDIISYYSYDITKPFEEINIGSDEVDNEYGVTREFTFTDDILQYGLSPVDITLSLIGLLSLAVVSVKGRKQDEEIELEQGVNYSIS
ncbi:unnamed protein product, partial [marine sediment metagenome]